MTRDYDNRDLAAVVQWQEERIIWMSRRIRELEALNAELLDQLHDFRLLSKELIGESPERMRRQTR